MACADGGRVLRHRDRGEGGVRREGSLTAVFGGIYLDSTLRRIDRHDAERVAEVVDTIRSGGPVDEVLSRFRDEGMSREEAAVWSGRRRRSAAWMSCSAVVTGGGFIDRFAGDAIIVAFNAVTDQSDHAMPAARAGLAIRSGAESLAADWPRFRIAVNTGGWSRSPAETE